MFHFWYSLVKIIIIIIIICIIGIFSFLITYLFIGLSSRRAVVSYWRKYVHKVLVNHLGGLSLSRKSVVRLDVYRGRKTTIQLLVYFI